MSAVASESEREREGARERERERGRERGKEETHVCAVTAVGLCRPVRGVERGREAAATALLVASPRSVTLRAALAAAPVVLTLELTRPD